MWAINHMERGRIDSSMTKTPSHSDGRLRSVLQSTKSHVFIAFHVRMSSYREMSDDFVQTFFFIHKMVHQAHNGMVFYFDLNNNQRKTPPFEPQLGDDIQQNAGYFTQSLCWILCGHISWTFHSICCVRLDDFAETVNASSEQTEYPVDIAWGDITRCWE